MIASMAEQKEQKGEIDSLRASIDSIKAELGKGEMVWRSRRSGKTTALMEFVHEKFQGDCIVVTISFHLADYWLLVYGKSYPFDTRPRVLAVLGRLNFMGHRYAPVVTDEVTPSYLEEHSTGFRECLKFFGGVGSFLSVLDTIGE